MTGERRVADVLSEIRKKLLTKKVTKYLFIWRELTNGSLSTSIVYNSIEETERIKAIGYEKLGPFPIEIDLPL